MIIFEFSRHQDDHDELGPSGFDFGDMDVVGDLGSASSTDDGMGAMMIFPSVSMLLDELCALVDRGRGGFDYLGLSSGFSLNFTLMKRRMAVRARRVKIIDGDAGQVLDAVWEAVNEFATRELPLLEADDPGRTDLEASIASFSRAIQRYAQADQWSARTRNSRSPLPNSRGHVRARHGRRR